MSEDRDKPWHRRSNVFTCRRRGESRTAGENDRLRELGCQGVYQCVGYSLPGRVDSPGWCLRSRLRVQSDCTEKTDARCAAGDRQCVSLSRRHHGAVLI